MLKLRPGTTSLRWTIWRAHAFVARFQVLDDEGAPRDLTGAAARLLLTPLGAELAVLEATMGAGIAIVDAATGVLEIDLSPTETRALAAGNNALDLAVTAADGAKLLHVRARIPVRQTQDALQGDAIVAGGADGLAELVDEAPELTDQVSATEAILISDPARAPSRRNRRGLKRLLDEKLDATISDNVLVPGSGVMSVVALLAKFLIVHAANPDGMVVGPITRDANGAAVSAGVVWPDGTPGGYAATVISTAYPGAVDAYAVTYGSPVRFTVTQPAVTRDATGAVVNRPAMTVT